MFLFVCFLAINFFDYESDLLLDEHVQSVVLLEGSDLETVPETQGPFKELTCSTTRKSRAFKGVSKWRINFGQPKIHRAKIKLVKESFKLSLLLFRLRTNTVENHSQDTTGLLKILGRTLYSSFLKKKNL